MFGFGEKTCDWCGTSFEGEGPSAGEMQFCSQACLDRRNAPAVVEPQPSRPLTPSMALSELTIAETEAHYYVELTRRYDVSCSYSEFAETQHTYIGVWQKLDTLREYAIARGADPRLYDLHRQHFADRPNTWEPSVHGGDSGGAPHFVSENAWQLLAAAGEIRRLLVGS